MKKTVSPGGTVSHAVTAALAARFLLVLGFALSTFAAPCRSAPCVPSAEDESGGRRGEAGSLTKFQ